MLFSMLTVPTLRSYASEGDDYQVTGYEATEVRIVQEGNAINDFQLGFKKPLDSSVGKILEENFSSWLMMYSQDSIDVVWTFLEHLSDEEIDILAQTSGANQMYRITNYAWADGLGNTFRAGQRDVVTGAEFGPGVYNLYVATQSKDGIVALAQADRQIDIYPTPKHVKVYGEGDALENYTVNFQSFDDPRLTHHFIFYSEEHLYSDAVQGVLSMTFDEVEHLSEQNRGKLVENKQGPIGFRQEQKQIDGSDFSKGVYYVYVASLGEKGVFGISYAVENIITADLPLHKTELINGGRGSIFAIGGSTDQINFQYLIDEFVSNEKHQEYIVQPGDVLWKIARRFNSSITEIARENNITNPNLILSGQRLNISSEKPRIAILSSSRDNLDTVLNHFYYDDPQYGSLEKDWIERGFEPIYIPLAIDSAHFVANNPYYANLIKTVDVVWLQGGDQNKHVRSLLNDDGSDTEIMKAIRYVHDRGGTIAGTSAGMHVMGHLAFGYGTPDISLQTNWTEHYTVVDIPVTGDLFPEIDNNNLSVPGIALLPDNVLTDTHFDARGRLGRILVALRDTGKTIGIGADEGTGIIISDGIGTVNGRHGVYIVDVSNAQFADPGSENVFFVEDVLVHYLTHGDRYDFETGIITVAEEKNEVTALGQNDFESSDIFDAYEMTKAIIHLSRSEDEHMMYRVRTNGQPQFNLNLHKNTGTKVYDSDLVYRDKTLSEVPVTSVINLELDIVQNIPLATGRGPQIISITQSQDGNGAVLYVTFDRDNLDLSTLTSENIILSGNIYWADEPEPIWDEKYPNEVEVNGDVSFVDGDTITILSGVKDNDGNASYEETWVRKEGVWIKQN